MSDLADSADAAIENAEADAVAHARHALKTRALAPCGLCYWCREPLRQAHGIYCDGVCADEHAADQRRITGRAV